ncbi:MAG: toprim domain-containing protein [Chthoniobacteraceae bacterium]
MPRRPAWFHRNLMKTQAAQGARDYLKKRGLTVEVAKNWQIGYAPDAWDELSSWAYANGFSEEELIRSGLVKVKAEQEPNIMDLETPIRGFQFYDRFRDRIMFPICKDSGEVIGFSGRVLSSDPQAAKYVNSPQTILFTKGEVLFGLHKSKRALHDKGAAIVCEGQIDLITAFESGVKNVIAPQGTAFTSDQARILKRHVEEVILCFDSDAAGQKAAERSLPHLLEMGLAVRVASMPKGQDPDSLIREEGPVAFVEQIENASDFFDFQIDVEATKPEFATPRGNPFRTQNGGVRKSDYRSGASGGCGVQSDSPDGPGSSRVPQNAGEAQTLVPRKRAGNTPRFHPPVEPASGPTLPVKSAKPGGPGLDSLTALAGLGKSASRRGAAGETAGCRCRCG